MKYKQTYDAMYDKLNIAMNNNNECIILFDDNTFVRLYAYDDDEDGYNIGIKRDVLSDKDALELLYRLSLINEIDYKEELDIIVKSIEKARIKALEERELKTLTKLANKYNYDLIKLSDE